MKCFRCQQDNPPQAKFCLECATPLALRCADCGTQLPAGAKFCFECATPISAPGSSPRLASPEVYTPKHLAERIINSKTALEGERKQVTVLFADLKGSMELLADRDPEEARKILDPVIERMMEAVHRYEGTVNQVMGDGIMALFGAPLAHEDHAVRACYAALRMQETVRQYSDELRRSQGVEVQLRVGVNSGEVVVRSIGSDLRMDYSAVGQTTHLAARMEQLATPGSTRITADSLRFAEGYVIVKPLGPVPIKGQPRPIEVYDLMGASESHARFQVAARRGLSHFVGRAREIEQLREARERIACGHGQVAALIGEAGVGKSRLIYEFLNSHHTHGWLVVRSGSVSYGKATAYLPVIDLLKDYFRIESRDDPRQIREKITGKVLALDEALRPFLPAFLTLLDVPVDDPDWLTLQPAHRRRQTHDGIRRLLVRESQIQPLCVVFEDLHWIDVETQAMIDGLVDTLPAARILLLVNYRPEYRHAWSGKTYYLQIRLDPLPETSASELLDTLLGPGASLSSLKRLLIERTQGNPFFLEESVRTLVEAGVVDGQPGAYWLSRAPGTIQVPPTVQAVLAARIDRLAPEDKTVLQSASAVGKDVPYAVLSAIADVPEDMLRDQIGRLQAAEFLYETKLFPDLEYTFKHAVTHDVTYGSLLGDRRRALHGRIVDAIERLAPDRLAEHVEQLAHHAARGEVWDKARVYLRQCAAKAVSRGALAEAAVYIEQALGVLERAERAPDSRLEAIDLHLMARNALYAVGEHERVLPHLEAAERLVIEGTDVPRLTRVFRYLSTHFFFTGDYPRAIEVGQRAVQAAEESADTDLHFETRLGLALVDFPRGAYRTAAKSLRGLISDMGEDGPKPRFFGINSMSSTTLDFLAAVLAELGEFDEAMVAAEDARRRADAHESRHGPAIAAWAAGYVHVRRGNLRRATKELEFAVDRLRATSVNIVLPAAASILGLTYSIAGRNVEAIPLLEEAVACSRWSWIHSQPLVSLGEGYLLAGRRDAAESQAIHALELAQARGERGIEAWALRLLGETTAQSDAAQPRAEGSYREALTLANELGMRPLGAHCHADLAKLYERTGKRQEAQEYLATATTMYREMGMTYWLEKATKEFEAV
jgi:class 3 adenylate cyclase/tetratricopeptide (TPR) repeat protein